MKKITLIALAITLFFNANAQNSKMDDIQELMNIAGMDMLGDQIVNGFISMYKTNYGDDIPGLWDSINVIINESLGDLLDSIALIYDRVYTHEEVKSMIEIYQTPIGRKMIETMPVLMELSMQAGQNWATAKTPELEARIAPLVELYTEKEYSFEDFFNSDEEYDTDSPGIITDARSNDTKIHGSPVYKYSVNYNSKKWDILPNETINPVADLTFMSKNQEVYALIIAEPTSLTIQQLKAAAIFNMQNAADDVKTESIGLREVNGKEMLCLRISCNIQGDIYKYYNYYYSGDWGILQFIVFTINENFDKNLKSIEGLLSGLYVE